MSKIGRIIRLLMSKIGQIVRLLMCPLILLNFVLTFTLVPVALAFAPFYLIWFIGSADAFTCNHLPSKQIFCQHQSWQLFGLSHQQTEWQFREARAIVEDGGADGGYTYVLSLITSKGEVKVNNYWSNKQDLDRDVDQFNQLLKSSSQPTFYLRRKNSWITNITLFFFAITLSIPAFFIWYLLFYFCSRLLKAIFRFSVRS